MRSKPTKTYQSFSSKETKRFGERLAARILGDASDMSPKKGALVLALRGDLGAGKTTFAQGFLKGLGFKKRAASPTFVLIRRHSLRKRSLKAFTDVFHVDAYRLKRSTHLAALGFKEILADPRHIVLIEWPERVAGIMPRNAMRLTFRHGKHENERSIILKQPAQRKKQP
jgi:tRNA threonylcarbamoyladenosine biosynthesis protein TsaE